VSMERPIRMVDENMVVVSRPDSITIKPRDNSIVP
jgi:hypothetical protein